jgi:hypothetical protein
MNGRTIAQIILAVVVVAGIAFFGIGAYNAGVTQGLAQGGNVVVNPGAYIGGPYVGGWGYGWHGGFSFFGFLGTLFFIFLLFGLLRAAFGRGRGWGPGRWGGPGGPGGWDRHDPRGWEGRAKEIHDEWHRTHDQGGSSNTGGSATSGRGGNQSPT